MKEHDEETDFAPQDAPGPVIWPHGPVKWAQREITAPNDSCEMAACAIMDPPPRWQQTWVKAFFSLLPHPSMSRCRENTTHEKITFFSIAQERSVGSVHY